MRINEISAAIYGDATHVDELLQLNALSDPFDVKAGTRIRYYQNGS